MREREQCQFGIREPHWQHLRQLMQRSALEDLVRAWLAAGCAGARPCPRRGPKVRPPRIPRYLGLPLGMADMIHRAASAAGISTADLIEHHLELSNPELRGEDFEARDTRSISLPSATWRRMETDAAIGGRTLEQHIEMIAHRIPVSRPSKPPAPLET